jgi:hypothetical protein
LTAAVGRAEDFIRAFLDTPEVPAAPARKPASWMDAGQLREDAAKDALARWREVKALPRMPLIEYWDSQEKSFPGLSLPGIGSDRRAHVLERAGRAPVQHGCERPPDDQQARLPSP